MGYASRSPQKLSQSQVNQVLAAVPAVTITPEQLEIIASQVPATNISGKVDKVTGKSLVDDSEIAKIHSHTNNTPLNAIQEALTTALKGDYDGAVTHAGSAHAPSNAQANNISDVNATDLTDGGETALHTHPAGAGGLTQQQILRII